MPRLTKARLRSIDLAGGQSTIEKTFSSGDEPVGNQGLYDAGSFLSKRYFIGWAKSKDFLTNTSTKLYFADQTIATIFPEGLTGDNTLYAVFVGIDAAMDYQSKLYANKNMSAQKTVPNGEIISSSGFEALNVEKVATVLYDPTIERYELDLVVNFAFNRNTAHLVYRNPGGILTNSGQWSDGTKEKARYSHVDLHVEIDPRVTVAETISMSFTSYNFKLSYVMDGDYKLIQSFGNTGVPGSPTQAFSFPSNGKHSFIVRTTVRRDGNPQNALNAIPEQVENDMMLRSTSNTNFTISPSVAEAIANGEDHISFNGHIDGIARVRGIDFVINDTYAKSVHIDFAYVNPKVTFDKNAGSSEPYAVVEVEKNQSIANDSLTDQEMPSNPTREPDEDGTTYEFLAWNTASDGSGQTFNGDTIVNNDLTVYAIWRAIPAETEPTEVPTEAPTPEPTAVPTEVPTEVPTPEPTAVPTEIPTEAPTPEPTAVPTEIPTEAPTPEPTAVPTEIPTVAPTLEPTAVPTETSAPEPTPLPIEEPTYTEIPTETPTPEPTPADAPTSAPTPKPPAPSVPKDPTLPQTGEIAPSMWLGVLLLGTAIAVFLVRQIRRGRT